MKAALLKGPGEIVLEEVAVPETSDDEVLVEVKCCGICGSDVHSYKECLLFPAGTYLGHEFSGILAKVGKNVKGWKVGDRVTVNPLYMCGECYACQRGRQSQCEHGFKHAIANVAGKAYAGAFAKFIRISIPEWRLHRLPDEVSFEEGALVEPLSCALHGVRISDFRVGDDVMVLGAGPIGLSTVAALKYSGAGMIIATVTNEKRVELAKKLGADYVFNPRKVANLKEKVFELTNGKGIDIVFECSGFPEAFLSATSFLRRGSQVILLGIVEHELPILTIDWVINEWRLQGSLCYYADEFPMVIEFLRKHVLPVREMITSKIKLSNIVKEGFDVVGKRGSNEIKVMVVPDE